MKEAEFAVETSPNYLEAEKGANENPSVACQVLATQGQDAVRDLIEMLRRRRCSSAAKRQALESECVW